MIVLVLIIMSSSSSNAASAAAAEYYFLPLTRKRLEEDVIPLEAESYPPDEAASGETLRFRFEKASRYFWMALRREPQSDQQPKDTLIGYICSTCSAHEELSTSTKRLQILVAKILCVHVFTFSYLLIDWCSRRVDERAWWQWQDFVHPFGCGGCSRKVGRTLKNEVQTSLSFDFWGFLKTQTPGISNMDAKKLFEIVCFRKSSSTPSSFDYERAQYKLVRTCGLPELGKEWCWAWTRLVKLLPNSTKV